MLIKPMEPILSENVVDGDEWIHQIKWDGIRAITYYENSCIKLYTKKGNEQTRYYPEVQKIKTLIKGKQAILDGELIVLDENNKPSFKSILKRHRTIKTNNSLNYPVKYILFDIIQFNGIDLRTAMYEERKELLQKYVMKDKDITITDDFEDGKKLFEFVKLKGLEGIVSKNKYSKYLEGKRHNCWYKSKVMKKMLAVVSGVKLKDNNISSLILSIHDNGNYRYIGSVSIGLTSNDFALLLTIKDKLIDKSINLIGYCDKSNSTVFFKPLLTCWVSFLDKSDYRLRHAKLLGFSRKKPVEAIGDELDL